MKTMAAAMDFGTSKIVTLLAASGDYHRCSILGSGITDYDGYSDTQWNDPDKLGVAIQDSVRQVENESHRRIDNVYAGVPGEFTNVQVRQVEINVADGQTVSGMDTERVLSEAALQLNVDPATVLQRAPAYFSVDGGPRTMQPVGKHGSRLSAKVAVVTADPGFMDDVEYRLQRLGIRVNQFMCTAMGEAFLLISPDERDHVAAMVDMGYLHTELIMLEGDAMVHYQVLPMGGGHITADLAYGLEIPMSMAEDVKRVYMFSADPRADTTDIEVLDENRKQVRFPRDFVQQIVEARAEEMLDCISDAMDKSGISPDARVPIYLTGGGLSLMRGGREFMQNQFHRPVKIPAARAGKLNSPLFASSLGLIDMVFDNIDQLGTQSSVKDQLLGYWQSFKIKLTGKT